MNKKKKTKLSFNNFATLCVWCFFIHFKGGRVRSHVPFFSVHNVECRCSHDLRIYLSATMYSNAAPSFCVCAKMTSQNFGYSFQYQTINTQRVAVKEREKKRLSLYVQHANGKDPHQHVQSNECRTYCCFFDWECHFFRLLSPLHRTYRPHDDNPEFVYHNFCL